MDKCQAYYVTRCGDYLYYIAREYGTNARSIRRISPDGSDMEILREGYCDYLFISDGRLYFTDENSHLVSTDPDFGSLKTVVEKEVYYVYPICPGWIIYQDDGANESLAIRPVESGMEYPLNECRSYCPVIIGSDVYHYTMPDGAENMRRLCKTNLLTLTTEVSELAFGRSVGSDGVTIWTSNGGADKVENWDKITSDEESVGMKEDVVYFSPDYHIGYKYSGTAVSDLYLFKTATGGGESFR